MGPKTSASTPLQTAWICLGSNIAPERNLRAAVRLISREARVEAVSRVFESSPVGAPGSPSFLNAALRLRTELSPRRLKLDVLRAIESELGRVRREDRNAPRTIDLDLALYGQLIVVDEEAGLEVPDPEILTRAHVALPLADLDPDLAHPVTGESLARIAGQVAGGADIGVRKGLAIRPGWSHRHTSAQ